MTTTILLVFTTISTILLIVAIFVQIIEATRELIEATRELTKAIKELREMHKSKSKDNEVKFIGPGVKSLPFGKTPKIKRGRVKGGIH